MLHAHHYLQCHQMASLPFDCRRHGDEGDRNDGENGDDDDAGECHGGGAGGGCVGGGSDIGGGDGGGGPFDAEMSRVVFCRVSVKHSGELSLCCV